MNISKADFKKSFISKLFDLHGIKAENAVPWQIHDAVGAVVMELLSQNIATSRDNHLSARRACYFSAEFLVGRAVYNNLLCLGITDVADEALRECGTSLAALEDIEDAALGNGGLGRLAACFLDSAATLELPLDGYGIRYRYGLFKQTIENGNQCEQADDWAKNGDPWSRRHGKDTVVVTFADGSVNAVPYDMPIMGYKTDNVGNLRLWQAEPITPFDFNTFNAQKYDKAVADKNRAEDISRVLYPNDDTDAGRILRIKQQYFFSSASITDILKKYRKRFGTNYNKLADEICVQLNDTHPVVSVPELIRQLCNENVSFENAFIIATKVFNYTNHTVMAEALEKWYLPLYKKVLPEIVAIIKKLDSRLVKDMKKRGLSETEIKKLRIIDDKMIHMARLAIYMATYVNGVAEIHTEILKNTALNEWYQIYPNKFQNKTNGITQRRWLALCNPELTKFIKEKTGTNAFIKDLSAIKRLEPYAQEKNAIAQFIQIKQLKKQQLSQYLKLQGFNINPSTVFDVQIKRLHEYKRQLLNAFSILHLYYEIKEGRVKNFAPTTFLFGAKSAPGYARAKGIIKFINEIANLVNNDTDVKDYITVLFVPNYNVSMAEKLVAAADVSVQISTAGTEASGTGNMKLMLNGAVTLGTMDGANVEIVEASGIENNYIFGATVAEINEIMPTYEPKGIYAANKAVKRVVDSLIDGTFSDGGTGAFADLHNALLEGTSWQRSDYYYLLGDFDSFIKARLALNEDTKNKEKFATKCLMNISNASKFSSDRTIQSYADEIWHIRKV